MSMDTNQRHKSVVGGQFRGLCPVHVEELTGKGTPLKLSSEQQVSNDVLRLVKLSALKEKPFKHVPKACTKKCRNYHNILYFNDLVAESQLILF